MPNLSPIAEEISPERIAKHYSAALDSVDLINKLLLKETLTPKEQDRLDRNVQHLQIMVGKNFWTTEDLTPLNSAITAATS